MTPYRSITGHDKKYKPLILKWLSNHFGINRYSHSFADQYIVWSVWDGVITVTFDSRIKEQNELLAAIHPRFLGCPQYKTLRIVNEKTFYLEIKQLLAVNYPEITSSKLIHKNKERGGTGGWHSESDDFYTYDWEVLLSDGTSISYNNQKENMDMVKGDFIYNSIIQERAFVQFLEAIK